MAKTKAVEHGGGAATGLSDDFVKFLGGFIDGHGGTGGGTPMGQTAGANPMGKTLDIAGSIQQILGGGNEFGDVGKSLTGMIQGQQKEDIAQLNERFTGSGGGSSVGTPGAAAQAIYRAQAAPQAATALGKLQMDTILPILNMISEMAQKGTSQRESSLVVEPSMGAQIASALAGLAQGGGSLAGGINAGKVASFA